MGNCDRLKWNRKQLGVSQGELAMRAGVSKATIGRLEQDETAWDRVQNETYDKIEAVFKPIEGWKFIKKNDQNDTISNADTSEIIKVKDSNELSWADQVMQGLNEREKPKRDIITLRLLEVVMEDLKESESHEEFVANIELMKRILEGV